jgi:hypothetical protein
LRVLRPGAAELEYKVILVSEALSGHARGLHEATLATFYRIFGDVRPSNEIETRFGPATSNRNEVMWSRLATCGRFDDRWTAGLQSRSRSPDRQVADSE